MYVFEEMELEAMRWVPEDRLKDGATAVNLELSKCIVSVNVKQIQLNAV